MIKRLSTIGLVAVAAVSFTGVAMAADSGSAGSDQTQQLMQGYRQDAQQLKQIHDATLKHDPKLAKEQSQFESKVKSAVEKHGYNIKAGQKRMEKYAKELQNSKLSDAKRKQVMQQFQNERQKMIKARDAALKQNDIVQAGQKLEKDTISAMDKQNSKTEKLIADMKAKRQKLQQAMSQQQGHGSSSSK